MTAIDAAAPAHSRLRPGKAEDGLASAPYVPGGPVRPGRQGDADSASGSTAAREPERVPFRLRPGKPDEDYRTGYSHPGDMPEASFADFLDIVNPLQHIPVVGTLYREVTGDTIAPPMQVVGAALYGGGLGALGAIADVTLTEATGKSAEGHVMAMLGMGEETPAAPADAPRVMVADAGPARPKADADAPTPAEAPRQSAGRAKADADTPPVPVASDPAPLASARPKPDAADAAIPSLSANAFDSLLTGFGKETAAAPARQQALQAPTPVESRPAQVPVANLATPSPLQALQAAAEQRTAPTAASGTTAGEGGRNWFPAFPAGGARPTRPVAPSPAMAGASGSVTPLPPAASAAAVAATPASSATSPLAPTPAPSGAAPIVPQAPGAIAYDRALLLMQQSMDKYQALRSTPTLPSP
ncbi:hypothetical protein [Zavarzinia sp. CC-PAN008]|uniref:hypothetical protein n=1 Tax=Zavarzinia sp. CC-PAN008 TaxID=3243332 RepID=UPI003F7467C5